MTQLTCTACGSAQAAGAAWCAVCGAAFPRTGTEDGAAAAGPAPAAALAATAGPAAPGPGPGPGAGNVVPVHTGTTQPEHAVATVRGYAPPAPVPSVEPRYGGTGRRFAAYVVDAAALAVVPLVVVLVGLVGAGVPLNGEIRTVTQAEADQIFAQVQRTYVLAAVLALACWLALVVVEGRTGRSLGGLVLGLRTVDAETLRPIGVGRSLLRWLIVGASGLGAGILQVVVLLSPAFDAGSRHQGWHDKAVRSVVLRHRGPWTAPVDPTAFAGPAGVPAPTGWGAGAPGRPAPAVPAPAVSSAGPVPAGGHLPAAASPDPWGFPTAAPAAGTVTPGLITGVPGRAATASSPSAPAPAAVPAPAPVPAPASAPAPVPASASGPVSPSAAASSDVDDDDDVDGETRMAPARARVLVLELATGERYAVTGRTLLGRNPQAPTGEPWDVLTVPDPTRSVSKTHAELHPDPGGLWVVDRGSTNGTVVSVPGRSPQVAAPGARVRVTAGATLHVGDARIVVHPEAL
ncbi:RDD family protein [Xylanimonas protaetiae]|uniref:FHA domain-containing protein n=1 Tax=Xylanimonas protaetiae TaxID=2509457 RepID=A0A4P6F2A1_9MICO|nr:RDD family protein [Xylanimonas protaetiae]QAY69950.1 FHA domain-containing protein [Xylanimonas protaetiae]